MSYAKDAVSLSSYGGVDFLVAYDPNTILKARLSNNTASMPAATYKWDKFEVYSRYIYARLANPSLSVEKKKTDPECGFGAPGTKTETRPPLSVSV